MSQTGNPNWKPGCAPQNPAGRPPGTPNKTTAEAKAIILGAASILGGAEALAAWVKVSHRNAEVFWRDILPRPLPKAIDASVDTQLPFKEIQHYLVAPDGTVVDPLFLEMRGLTNGESEH